MKQHPLAPFRTQYPDCELVMLVDIAARTVLTSESAIRVGQEHLDGLLELTCALISTGAAQAGSAILAGPTGSRVLLRSPHEPAEVVVAVFPPGADLSGVVTALQGVLDKGADALTGA